MKQKFALNKNTLDSMHDQRIHNVELAADYLIFSYKFLNFYETGSNENKDYYNKHKNFTSCNVIFNNGQDAFAEIRTKNRLNVTAKIYYIEDFIDFVHKNKYTIETTYYYSGYNTVIVHGSLINSGENYFEDCIITIPSSRVTYQWASENQ